MRIERGPVPRTENPEGTAVVREGVVVGRAGGRNLLGDLYVPATAAELRPALVVVHGGGWRRGAPRSVRGFGELLGRAGFVCLLASYRLAMEAPWPAQIEDVKCAIRFLRARSASLGVDPDRIGIVGDSAGGHLALMAAASSSFEGDGGHAEHSSAVAAVGSMYGPTRIRFDGERPNHVALMGDRANEADYDRASPITCDLGGFPPCLLIHGVEDEAVPVADSLDFYERLKRLGRPAALHLFSGEGHAFDRKTGEVGAKMVDIADSRSIYGRVVVQIIALFFGKYLRLGARLGAQG